MKKLMKKLLAAVAAGAKMAGGPFYKLIEDIETNVSPDGKTIILLDPVEFDNDGRKTTSRSLQVTLAEGDVRFIRIASDAIEKKKFTIGLFEALRSQGSVEKGDEFIRAY